MTGYHYLDLVLKFEDDSDLILTPTYFKGSIEQSLRSIFGDIGGQTEVDILKLDSEARRGIIRVPSDYYVKTRAAITLISKFQGIRCHFHVKNASSVLFRLLSTHIEI